MFNLSQKASKHFKKSFSNLESREGDYWRLDIVYINRRKILMCVHEPTVYTTLLHGTDFKTLDQLFIRLRKKYPWYVSPFNLGKGSNRHVSGTMTDMKIMMKYDQTLTLHEYEELINETPFSILNYGSPDTELQRYLLRN